MLPSLTEDTMFVCPHPNGCHIIV